MTKCMSNRLVIIRSWLAVFLWMALIFYLSSQVASQSDELSRGIAEILFSYLEKIFPELNTEFINSNFIVRKCVCLAIRKYNFWQSKVQLPVPPYLLHQ